MFVSSTEVRSALYKNKKASRMKTGFGRKSEKTKPNKSKMVSLDQNMAEFNLRYLGIFLVRRLLHDNLSFNPLNRIQTGLSQFPFEKFQTR